MKYNTIEEDLAIMQFYDITAESLFLIKLMLAAQEDNGRQKYLVEYFSKCRRSNFPLEMLEILGEKNIIIKQTIPKKGDRLIVDNIHFTNSFLKNWFIYSHEAGKELFEAYPSYLQTFNGELYPAKSITKVFISLEAMYDSYGKSIRYSRIHHDKIMNLLEWGKENKLIKVGIAEFVVSKQWEILEKNHEEQEQGLFDSNYDNKTVV